MNRWIYLAFFIVFFTLSSGQAQSQNGLPEGFVHVAAQDLGIFIELRYAGSHNFLGRPVIGYEGMELTMTEPTAARLKRIVEELNQVGLTLKIYDAYRPQKAVDDFVAWSKIKSDTIAKVEFYPDIPKDELFERGYIALKSGHSRGSTVDLTLVEVSNGQILDMGSDYDFFGEISHVDYDNISAKAKENRSLLQSIMLKHGFKPYAEEWWHFTLEHEPFPKTYFDF